MDPVELKRRGNRALVQRKYAEAEEAFRQLVAEHADSHEGYFGLARVLDSTQRHSEIVDLLSPVVGRFGLFSLTRALADAYRVLAYRGDRQAVDPAILHYEAARSQRADPLVLYYLGELYREKKRDFRRALAALHESWVADPGSPTLLRAAAHCARMLGDPEADALLKRMRSEASKV